MAVDLTGLFQGGPAAKGEDFYKQFPGLRPAENPESQMWPDASRGLPEPGMSYTQGLTPVNMNDPVELARWRAKYGQKTPAAAPAALPGGILGEERRLPQGGTRAPGTLSGAGVGIGDPFIPGGTMTRENFTWPARTDIPMTFDQATGTWVPQGSPPQGVGGPADLSRLDPYRQASRRVLDQSFQPGGGVPQQDLQDLINKQLWGTGESTGVYSQMARRGLNELQPETQYATSRAVRDAIQDLANQYSTRQRAAIESGRTTEMVEPNFRLTEAGVTGTYGGTPTLANTLGTKELDIRGQEAATRSEQLANDLSFRQNLLLGSSIGAVLEKTGLLQKGGAALWDLIFGPSGDAGGATGGGGGVAGALGGGTAAAAAAATLAKALGIPLPELVSLLSQSGIPQASIPGLLESGELLTQSNLLTELIGLGPAAGPAASTGLATGIGPAAPSIEAGLIEMLGPELAAQLGYTGAGVAGAGAGAIGASTGATAIGSGLTVGGGEAAVGAMLGAPALGTSGAGVGGAAGGGLLGGGAGAAAAVLPAATIAGLIFTILRTAGVIGPPSDTQAGYDTATRSIGNKAIQGYDPSRFAAEYPALPGQDQGAIRNRIVAAALGANTPSSAYGSTEGTDWNRLLAIMQNENRMPSTLEYLSATPGSESMFRDWTRQNWQSDYGPFAGSLQEAQAAGKLTMDPDWQYFDKHYGTTMRADLEKLLAGQPNILGLTGGRYPAPAVNPLGTPFEDRGR